MKKGKFLFISCFLLFVVLVAFCFILFSFIKNDNKAEGSDSAPYLNVRYRIPLGYCSCISFQKFNSFSEYDCDSEPTGIPFSGEFYSKYFYNKKKDTITFWGSEFPLKVKVLKWNEDEFKVKVLNYDGNGNMCSINNKDIYSYYRSGYNDIGKNIKDRIINYKLDIINIALIFGSSQDKCMANHTVEEYNICNSNDNYSLDDIFDKIVDSKKYSLEINRDKNGNIESFYVFIGYHEDLTY